jgi:eukaryotic-like serine/threonine-protein kinase
MNSRTVSLHASALDDSRPLAPDLEQLIEATAARMQAGEAIDLDQLITAHPHYADELRELLPAVELLVLMGEAPAKPPTNGAPCNGAPCTVPYQQLGDFRLIRELGHGGMGTVYEAEQLSMGRHVALKVLPFAALVDEKSLQRFRNEVRAAAALDHPHIVSVYSVGEERGVHFYAMQLIRGRTLADLIAELRVRQGERAAKEIVALASDRAPMIDSATSASPSTKPDKQARLSTAADSRQAREFYRTAARLGIEAAEALRHAHDQGVMHRDIKPGNLMLDGDAKLYVTDFGLARIEADAGLTMTGDLLGTLRYMAPEQALAKRVVIDHRADVYSLGATLYELLTLQPAFAETDRGELLKQIAFYEPRSLRKLDRWIPIELETIVLKAMAKQPDDRYQSAQQLADDLHAFLEHRPIKAKPSTLANRVSKWSRRHVVAAWSALAVLSLLAVILAGSTALVASAWKETQRSAASLQTELLTARRNLYRANVQTANQELAEGHVAEVDRLLDEFLPKPGQQDLRGWEWYYLKSLCDTEERSDRGKLISGTNASINPFVFDRNGASLIVRKFNSPDIVLSLPASKAEYFVASPDGRLLACCAGGWFSQRTAIEVWDLAAHVRQAQIEFDMGITAVAWAPDGRRLAISQPAIRGNPEQVNVWGATNGEKLVRLVGSEGIGPSSLAWSPDGAYVAVGGNPKDVAICSATTGKLVRRLDAQKQMIESIAFSPDGRLLASGSWDQTIHIWTVETGTLEHKFIAHNGYVNALSWSADGSLLASGGGDSVTKIWDTSTWELTNALIGHRDQVTDLDWIDSKSLITGGSDGSKSWDVQKKQGFTLIPTNTSAHSWTATGRQLVTWQHHSDGATLDRYDLENRSMAYIGRIEKRSPSESAPPLGVTSMDISPTGKLLAAAIDTDGLQIWDLSTNQRTLTINLVKPEQSRRVAWSPDGTMLATGEHNSSFKIWNSTTGDCIATLAADPDDMTSTAKWSPDGSLLATITYWGDICLWDVKQWKMVRRMPHEFGRIWSPEQCGLAWSPTGDRLAAKVRGWMYIWDAKTGHQLLSVHAHVANILCIAWSPDGSRLATGSEDHTIKIWNPDTAEEMLTLPEPDHTEIRSLSWSPDGRCLARGSGTRGLKVRDASPAYARDR